MTRSENNPFSEDDLRSLESRGIKLQEVFRQIETFRQGVNPIRLNKPARIGDGIVQIPPEEVNSLVSLHDQAAERGRMIKFVPASGAASRMFKDWYDWYQQRKFNSTKEASRFLNNIVKFPFYEDLKTIMSSQRKDIEHLIQKGEGIDILEYILTPKGLNYAGLPKGFIKFHRYPGGSRTAIEEHLVEAAYYIRDGHNVCKIYFSISEEHESYWRSFLSQIKSNYETLLDVKYEIDLTIQSPSTDTLAVDMENKPFRDRNGKMVFRPGGHGALLKNLNAIQGDIIFIKNIDNVIPDRMKDITILYKKILGGILIQLQDKSFGYLKLLSRDALDNEKMFEVIRFCQDKLSLFFPEAFWKESFRSKKEYLFQILNRPLRICGMVQNEGEPGGGPFWVEKNGIQSLQIVEENQIDLTSKEQRDIWNSSTHFNPVDLACGIRNFKGEKFDLNSYIDQDTALISKKTHEGRELKALELPGLWNGSMAFWNTVFVEVPIETFNPVKTIDDLLRKSHQP